jgi:WhiB family transcriptional regulator, redox-sensing transcriptional regulator
MRSVISWAASPTEDVVPAIERDTLHPLAKQCPDVPCRVLDSALWFADAPEDLERAKTHCQECPARVACLSGALERREPWGVWGGQILQGGAVVAHKRPRGRPRRTAA